METMILPDTMQKDEGSNTLERLPSMDDDDEAAMPSDPTKPLSDRMMRSARIRELGDIERNAIGCLRYFIAFLMIVTTITAGVLTWCILQGAESREFFKKFEVITEDIKILSERRVLALLSEYRTLSLTISGLAINSRSEWPFFTDSSFPTIVTSIMKKTRTHMVYFSPIVHNVTESEEWSTYSQANQNWIKDAVEKKQAVDMALTGRRLQHYHDHSNHHDHGHHNHEEPPAEVPEIFPAIYRLSEGEKLADTGPGPFLPSWQMVEAPRDANLVNYNLLSDQHFADVFNALLQTNGPVMTDLQEFTLKEWNSLQDHSSHGHDDHGESPFSMFMFPVFRSVASEEVVAILMSDVNWQSLFPLGSDEVTPPVYVVVDGGCERKFTFRVSGTTVDFLGYNDFHDTEFDVHERSFPFTSDLPSVHGTGLDCSYSIHVYPTRDFWEEYHTSNPPLVACTVSGAFLLMSIILLAYDCAIHTRQRRIARDASKSQKILEMLYPKNVRARLFGHRDDGDSLNISGAKRQLKNFVGNISQLEASDMLDSSKPIADLFMDATVLFADISGFTSWSSVREPTQVFTLLESVYCAFDHIAKKRKVFKVETVGDCYVAVTGLPEPTKEHASIMAVFARECVNRFKYLVHNLETTLGPDTGDLCIRVGLHSGPVTAGVLRGDKSRFQLFGDTVNTCARLESTGKRNRIQVSEETAELLTNAGKEHLLEQRKGLVEAKGKGKLKTFWLLTIDEEQSRGRKIRRSAGAELIMKSLSPKKFLSEALTPRTKKQTIEFHLWRAESELSPKTRRLCQWNVDILLRHLKQIVAFRNAAKQSKTGRCQNLTKQEGALSKQRSTINELVEIIPLPGFDAEAFKRSQDQNDVELPGEVVNQVKLFVTSIAIMYRSNPFHNFEHASHVTMSVSKLLSRIIAADDIRNIDDENAVKQENFGWSIHDHTYGITSDPMTQFTVILAALIHDVDHLGVSNAQLVREGHSLADLFENKSIAEQNSIAMTWDLLMDPRFVDFRRTIYTNEFELVRFRQLMANTVLATDIMDKELQLLRRKRWDVAFKGSIATNLTSTKDKVNRKATIVIEHLIQASDVAHTMQHWHVYCKWNERLFHELILAYKAGRLDFNPAEKWYEGELSFFDNYVIPLAKKLKDCGVFGVASDEYLLYAQDNRREFEEKGREIVSEMENRYIHCTKELQISPREIPRPPL